MSDEVFKALIAATFTPTVGDRKKVLLEKWNEAWSAASKKKCPFKVEVEVESRALTTMTLTRTTPNGVQSITNNMMDDYTYAQCDQAVKSSVKQVLDLIKTDPPPSRKRARRSAS